MTSQPRPEGRFVWMTHAEVSWLHTSTDTPQRREALMRLNTGFNSAPADAAEAIANALLLLPKTPEASAAVAASVLRALGYPHTEQA